MQINERIDIHTHILPGVDDGSKDIETSVKMLEMEKAQGVSSIVLTPHFMHGENRYTPESLKETFDVFCDDKRVKDTGIELFLGNEIFYSKDITEDLDNGYARTVDGKRRILLEFAPYDSEEDIINGCKDIYNSGYTIVLAHIERYTYITDKAIDKLLAMDTMFQMNSAFVKDIPLIAFGHKGWYKDLLKYGLVSFIATDTHNMTTRKPDLYVKEINKKYSKEADDMFYNNAYQLLYK